MQKTTIFHAPDGMSTGNRTHETRPSAERPARRDEHEYDHDDGLVHDHAWARTSPER